MIQRSTRVLSLTRTERYGIAVVGVLATAVLRLWLDPFLQDDLPLSLFIFPIVLAGWLGGLWPGLLATAFSLLLGDYLFLAPRGSILHFETRLDLTRALVLGFAGLAFSIVFQGVRRSIGVHIESLSREMAERRSVEDALRASDERHRAFIENSSEAIWRFELEQPIPVTLSEDEQVKRLYEYAYLAECNVAMALMYGYKSPSEIMGARLGDLLVGSDPQNLAFLRALRQASYRLTDVETHEVDRYGNSKYFLNNLVAIIENGLLTRAWGTQRDITDQKQAEEALRVSEERLRRITYATQDTLWEIDLKTGQLWRSEGEKPLFGYSSGELSVGLEDWYRRIHPEDVGRVRAKFEQFMSDDSREWFDEYRLQGADGSYVHIHDQGRRFYDETGTPTRIAGATADITKRKLAEQQLNESEMRFAKAFRMSPNALVISRIADGVILEANDSFVSLSGYARDEVIGNSTLLMDLYADPADRERAVAILKEQNFVRDFEFQMKRKSGEKRTMSFSAEPFELHGERCWLTISRDITEQRRIEQERELLLVQEKAARAEAEAASRMKDEFLATISHELRTPLTSILGWSNMLTTGSLSEPQIRHALEVIEQSARSQAKLVDDILDTSRIITGRMKLEAEPIELERVLQAAVDAIGPSAKTKRITLRMTIDRRCVVLGDSNRLEQAIWNLLSNAVKFTDDGGRIEARQSCAGNRVEISISDTGIGIDPEFRPYVFERFRQADSTSTRRYGGLGLGLAIVRHVIEMHGGHVTVSSGGKGQGSTFKITLPAMTPAESAIPTKGHPPGSAESDPAA